MVVIYKFHAWRDDAITLSNWSSVMFLAVNGRARFRYSVFVCLADPLACVFWMVFNIGCSTRLISLYVKRHWQSVT